MTAVLETQTPSVRSESGRPVPLGRLTVVELRKLADTRAGLWLLIVIGLATVGTSAIMLGWATDAEQTFEGLFGFGMLPSAVLLPVLGILSMTAEWSQRTALTTFTLVPARERVIVAKLAAGVIIAIASTVATLALAAVANLLAGALGGDGGWDIAGSLIWQGLAMQVLYVLMGLGFGALLLNSPLAIVAFFALPTVWTILGETIKALRTATGWIDINTTTTAMGEANMTGDEWARVGVSAAIWVLVPLALGIWRVLRREVS
ncbi:ABC transporter permease [Actinoplanes sp. TRM 88003]|uniref:ABC transporter permease n=1 Tax=Paractinoplanes aksuensis TaxID=2939490 RepID=A0ABT1DKD2_9ACTN|nr:ABC transporter permease [Actinoplanes aksuensis]MCO8271307.1 ABC transporter permease [Actinoplanes aksuensis]